MPKVDKDYFRTWTNGYLKREEEVKFRDVYEFLTQCVQENPEILEYKIEVEYTNNFTIDIDHEGRGIFI